MINSELVSNISLWVFLSTDPLRSGPSIMESDELSEMEQLQPSGISRISKGTPIRSLEISKGDRWDTHEQKEVLKALLREKNGKYNCNSKNTSFL